MQIRARFAADDEIKDWDRLVQSNPNGGNMLQSETIAEVKAGNGWTPRYLVYEGVSSCTADQVRALRDELRASSRAVGEAPKKGGGGKKHKAAPQPTAWEQRHPFRTDEATGRLEFRSYNLVLEKKFPGLGRLWYLSKGPDVYSVEDIPALVEAHRDLDRREKLGLFLVKMEPDVPRTDAGDALLSRAGLVKQYNIQPNDSTPLVYTDRTEEELFASFHTKARNKIRRGQSEELDVRRVELTDENMRTMYALMDTVGQGRAHVTLRPYEYYRDFWSGFGKRGQGRLYFCYEGGTPAVGAFVVNYGDKATYKDGGSAPKRSVTGDAHLIQWTSMTALMEEHDILEYDLCACPPRDQLKNPEHRFYGIGQFKTTFTRGKTVDWTGVWDQPMKKSVYAFWTRLGEPLARRAADRLHHQPLY